MGVLWCSAIWAPIKLRMRTVLTICGSKNLVLIYSPSRLCLLRTRPVLVYMANTFIVYSLKVCKKKECSQRTFHITNIYSACISIITTSYGQLLRHKDNKNHSLGQCNAEKKMHYIYMACNILSRHYWL